MLKLGGYCSLSTLWFWDDDSSVSVDILKTKCVQFRSSPYWQIGLSWVRIWRTMWLVSIEWSIRITLCCMSIFDSAANALLTVPIAVGNLSGNTTLLQLGTMEEIKGRSSTHGKSFDNYEIDAWEDWRGLWVISSFIPGTRPTKEI